MKPKVQEEINKNENFLPLCEIKPIEGNFLHKNGILYQLGVHARHLRSDEASFVLYQDHSTLVQPRNLVLQLSLLGSLLQVVKSAYHQMTYFCN